MRKAEETVENLINKMTSRAFIMKQFYLKHHKKINKKAKMTQKAKAKK